tara:strand:+ start:85403 stop:86800 length:1398 start_codon:yes stop_codon:yes gene_type:complete
MTYQFTKDVNPKIFRAYDIRGIADDDNLHENAVYTIGVAIGSEALSRGEKTIITGRDGRLSSPALGAALIQGFLDAGCDVVNIGIVATPLVYFASNVLEPNSGVMLTGSHNPGNYNGIKIVLGGTTLAEDDIQKLYHRIQNNDVKKGNGSLSEYNIIPEYVEYVSNNITLSRPLKIVIDCGNGAAGVVAPELYRAMGCDVTELFTEVDGHFPNHHPDPSRLENVTAIIEKVKEIGADIGLAFDGDADRLGVITSEGEMIFPDRQVMVFAKEILSRHPGADIVYDVKCSRYLTAKVKEWGGNPIMWKTGHSLLKAKLWETGAPLAGEMSGHIFFKDRWFGFDDGLYAGVRMLEILANDTRTSAQMFTEDAPKGVSTPEINIHMDDDKKFAFVERLVEEADFPNAKKFTLDGLRVEFPDGWGLVRCSNTTPCLVTRFEADNEAALKRIQADVKQVLLKLNSDLDIPF